MTYFEIVNRIKDIVFRHKILVDFGYGNLSDIKSVSENFNINGISDTGRSDQSKGVDYPYVFVNPQAHSRSGQSISYRFNLIVMDQAKNDFEVLKVQSDCQQYIDDIISELRFDYKDAADVILNVTLTPFKERFQDTVAGMTATLEIQVADNINNCIAPIYPRLADPIVDVYNASSQIIDADFGPGPGGTAVFQFPDTIVNDGNWNDKEYTTPSTGTYSFVMEYDFQFTEESPGQVFPAEPTIRWKRPGQIEALIGATDTQGWPTNPETGVTYTITQRWLYFNFLEAGDLELFTVANEGGDQIRMDVAAGASLKIYRA